MYVHVCACVCMCVHVCMCREPPLWGFLDFRFHCDAAFTFFLESSRRRGGSRKDSENKRASVRGTAGVLAFAPKPPHPPSSPSARLEGLSLPSAQTVGSGCVGPGGPPPRPFRRGLGGVGAGGCVDREVVDVAQSPPSCPGLLQEPGKSSRRRTLAALQCPIHAPRFDHDNKDHFKDFKKHHEVQRQHQGLQGLQALRALRI